MSSDDLNTASPRGAIAHRVLIVENEPETAESLKEFLERHGSRVDIAKDGGQAQSSFMMRKPDFVILELLLPGESGFEICQRLKQTDENVPVMILSVIDMPDAFALAERVGADGYLTKPYDPNELLETIKQIAATVWQRTHSGRPKDEQRIRFSCECGKRFKVSPTHRGRTMTCPDCGESLIVPRHA